MRQKISTASTHSEMETDRQPWKNNVSTHPEEAQIIYDHFGTL